MACFMLIDDSQVVYRWQQKLPMPMNHLLNTAYKLLGCFCNGFKLNQLCLIPNLKLFESHIGVAENGSLFKSLHVGNKTLSESVDKKLINSALDIIQYDSYGSECAAFADFLSAISWTCGKRNAITSANVMAAIDQIPSIEIPSIEDLQHGNEHFKIKKFVSVVEIYVAACEGAADANEIKAQSLFDVIKDGVVISCYDSIIDGVVEMFKQVEGWKSQKEADDRKRAIRDKLTVAQTEKLAVQTEKAGRDVSLAFKDVAGALLRFFHEVFVETGSQSTREKVTHIARTVLTSPGYLLVFL